MIRGREIKNLPVVEVAGGRILGSVQDLVLSDEHKLQGLSFKTETGQLRFLPQDRIINLGRDAVLVQGEPEEFPLFTTPYSSHAAPGTWVMTADGKNIGTIDDVVVEEEEGSVIGYEVSDGYLMDLLVGRKIVAASNIITYGKDAVIVEENFLNEGEWE